jgi:hypothetical protein
MYLRLVVMQRDQCSLCRRGVFLPAYDLLESDALSPAESDRLGELIDWYERHLPLPDRTKLEPMAIFWFKANAVNFIRRIWELVTFLEEYDHHVEFLRTSKPGYISYEDDFQVGARPFRDSRIA